MAYRLKDYLYNDKLTKEQNILMDRLYKLRMSGMAEAFEKQLLEPNTGLEPFEVRFAAIVNQEWDQRESKKFKRLMKKATLKYPAADLDSSIYDPERQLNTHVIELLAKCDWIDEPNNLLMTGGAGAGENAHRLRLMYHSNASRTVLLNTYVRTHLLKESDHAQAGRYLLLSIRMIEACRSLMVIDDFGLMDLDIEKCRDLFEIIEVQETAARQLYYYLSDSVSDGISFLGIPPMQDACLSRMTSKAYRLEFLAGIASK